MKADRKPSSQRPRRISPARIAAFDILLKIEAEAAYSSVLLPLVTETLDPRDRALCHEICLGVLRKKLYLDRIIDKKARGKKLDLEVRVALWIGLYQLLFLDRVPAHSAIDESVSLTARAKKVSAKGLVNAVLRSVVRDGAEPVYPGDRDKAAVETSHPQWLLDRWTAQFGEDVAIQIGNANNQQPKIAFRFTNIGSGTVLPDGVMSSRVADGGFIAERSSPELREFADKHLIYFQDEGSQMVGQIVAQIGGKRLLDVAAAPGSKTTQIAKTGNFSFLVAGDLHGHRVRSLSENCHQQGVGQVAVVQYDAEFALPFAGGQFDTILLDAPCSGTGTIRNNPEIRYNLKQSDIAELASKQRRILQNASELLRSGGSLIYSTCSLEREENEEVVEQFLRANNGWKAVSPAVPAEFLTPAGYVRTFPHRDEMDGFFVAVLQKD